MVKSPYRTDLPHVEAHFDAVNARWSEPVVVDNPHIRIHPLASGFSYAQQCFEGMKAFRGTDGQIRLFRPKDHAARFNVSATYVALPQVPEDLFLRAVEMAVLAGLSFLPAGNTLSLYVRPILAAMTPHLSPLSGDLYTLFVYTAPMTAHMGTQPLSVLVEENFDRAAANGTGAAKIAGNYGPLMPSHAAANARGYQTTLHLDPLKQNHIEEFAFSGFIGIKGLLSSDDITLVIAQSESIVKSITVSTCIRIAQLLGWKIEIRTVHFSELSYFDEVIAAGTACSVCEVQKIYRESTNETFVYPRTHSESGAEVTRKLADVLRSVQYGESEDLCDLMLLINTDARAEKPATGRVPMTTQPHL